MIKKWLITSILVRVDILTSQSIRGCNNTSILVHMDILDPCSCGYYVISYDKKRDFAVSILVRVDIILLFSPSMGITHNFSSYSVENAPPL